MKNKYFLILIIIIQLFISIDSTLSQTSQDEEYPSETTQVGSQSEPEPTQETYQDTEYPGQTYPAGNFFDKFSGYLTLRYKGRNVAAKRGSDQDFYQSLSLKYGQPYQDKFSAYLYGTLRQDIDDPSSLFRSIDDTFDGSLRAYLYELYGNIKDIGIIENAKIGRQYLLSVESLHFDGVHLSFKPFHNIRLAAYGGAPVHLFESSSDGDWISGISAELKPIESSTIQLDYITASDNNDSLGDQQDNLFIISAWQRIRPWWNIYGRYSHLDSISRDIQVRSSWNFPSINLDVQFSYYKQPQALDNFTIDFDEFTSSAGTYQPYDQYTLDIYKGIGAHMGINLGASLRELKDESDERSFNHDFERYYITYSIYDYPLKGLTISVTGEDFESAGDDVQSIGFDVTQDFKKRLRISLGTYYSLYKFDITTAPDIRAVNNTPIETTPPLARNPFFQSDGLTDSERDNVRTFYLKAKKKIFDHWELSAGYELESFDSDIFHTLKTALKFKF